MITILTHTEFLDLPASTPLIDLSKMADLAIWTWENCQRWSNLAKDV